MTINIKSLFLRTAPLWVVRLVGRWHYPRIVAGFNETDWPYGRYVRAIIEEGCTVVDVGANVGYISGLLARMVGDKGTVISLEPVPETYSWLKFCMRRLGYDNVTTHQVGASSKAGVGRMEIPAYRDGGENYYQSRIVHARAGKPSGRAVDIELITLDELLKPCGSRIAFVKIDVEGHELEVIRGAHETIRKSKPALLVEIWGNPDEEGSGAHATFELLGDCGYNPWLLEGQKLRRRQPSDSAVDYLFLRAEHYNKIRTRSAS